AGRPPSAPRPAVPARAHDLRPVQGNGLPRALHLAACRRGPTLMRSAGLATTLEVRGQVPEVPAGVQLTVYRLGPEALTNNLKHGGPRARAPGGPGYVSGGTPGGIEAEGAGGPAPGRAGG